LFLGHSHFKKGRKKKCSNNGGIQLVFSAFNLIYVRPNLLEINTLIYVINNTSHISKQTLVNIKKHSEEKLRYFVEYHEIRIQNL